jgi:hypothetical protein
MWATRKTWRECTIDALRDSSKKSALVHRSALLKEYLNKIVIETKSNGKTPDMTFNRMLQVLRDDGYIKFVTPGVYLWLYKIHNGQIFIQARSTGESVVADILDELNIIYEEQKTFTDLKYKGLLRLDFYIEHNDKKYAIEFDGEQHYRPEHPIFAQQKCMDASSWLRPVLCTEAVAARRFLRRSRCL